MNRSTFLSGFLSGAALIASLGSGVALADSAEWNKVAYSCESGETMTVAYRENGKAVQVVIAEQPAVKLVARPANAGFRYGSARHELRGEGNTVTWKVGSRTPVKCTSDDPAAAQFALAARR